MPHIGYYFVDEHEIHYGIKDKQFTLYLQPIINSHQESFETLEVFIRWNHPLLGILPPRLFMSRIKSEALQLALTQYIIEESFRLYQLSLLSGKAIGINININAQELHHPKTVSLFRREMINCDIEYADNICLELSPTILNDERDFSDAPILQNEYLHLENLRNILLPYQELGLTLALDTCNHIKGAILRAAFLGLHAVKISGRILEESLLDNGQYLQEAAQLAQEHNVVLIGTNIETDFHIETCLTHNIIYLQGMRLCNAVERQDLHHWNFTKLHQKKQELQSTTPHIELISDEQRALQKIQEENFSSTVLIQHKQALSFRDALPKLNNQKLTLEEVDENPFESSKMAMPSPNTESINDEIPTVESLIPALAKSNATFTIKKWHNNAAETATLSKPAPAFTAKSQIAKGFGRKL